VLQGVAKFLAVDHLIGGDGNVKAAGVGQDLGTAVNPGTSDWRSLGGLAEGSSDDSLTTS
jgi:hypothetical protein